MITRNTFIIFLILTQTLGIISTNVQATGLITVPDDYSNIQAAINSASPGDTIYVRNSTYHESLTIDKPIKLIGENKSNTIINGLGNFEVVSINSDDVSMSGFTVTNGSTGIDISYADEVTLSNIIVHNITYGGISMSDSYSSSIINCTAFNNSYGIEIYESLYPSIINCETYNNSQDGIYCSYTRNIQILGTSSQGNYNGLYLYRSDYATICSSIFNENENGIDVAHSDRLYISNSSFVDNARDGLNFWYGSGVSTNSNYTGNSDDGLEFWECQFRLRYCELWGNADYEIESYDSSIDAMECWWGSPSEPTVTGGIEYDPWLTSIYHPDVLISDLRCQLTHLDWLVVYPDEKTPKPLGCVAASVSDWLASAFMTTKLQSFTEGLDTQSDFVNQSSGEVIAESGIGVLTFGGPIVNPIVKRAENSGTPDGDRAPVKFHDESGVFHFQYKNGTNIPGAELSVSKINDDEDIFVIERYVDNSGRIITICYGFGWKGTYAAGKYIEFELYPQQETYTTSWVIVKWDDTNLDGFVNNPGEGDTYTIIAEG